MNGRFGPYINSEKKNYKIPKDIEPKSLTLEKCKEIMKEAPKNKGRSKAKTKGKAKAKGKKK